MVVVHKIIDGKRLITANNIVCHTDSVLLSGCELWVGVTCKKCLKKNFLTRNAYTIIGGVRYPNRRDDACDICAKNVPTEFFAGFCKNSLWICHKCYNNITGNIERKHPYIISKPKE